MSDTRVYFIRSVRSKAIKIGVAENPRQRLSSMQTGSIARLELVAEMPGDERYERVLHEAFAEYRIRGEWFRLDGRLAAFVSALPAMYALETRRSRAREEADKPKPTPDPRQRAYWMKVMLPAIRDAVLAFGVDGFADIAQRKRSVIIRAIHNRGVHFAAEDFMLLCAVCDEETAQRLLNLFMAPFGLRVRTPQQAEEDRRAAEKLQRIRDEVIAVLGPEDGRKFLDQFDAEIEEEQSRRRAEHEANPWAIPGEAR